MTAPEVCPVCEGDGWVQDPTWCGDENHCDAFRPCPSCPAGGYGMRYAVVRPAPGLPADRLPAGLDGKWFDLDEAAGGWRLVGWTVAELVATATGRYERRDSDGAHAEVYEVREVPR